MSGKIFLPRPRDVTIFQNHHNFRLSVDRISSKGPMADCILLHDASLVIIKDGRCGPCMKVQKAAVASHFHCPDPDAV